PLDKKRCPAVAPEQAVQLVVADAGEDGGVVDLVAVEVKDWQHGAVPGGIEELVGVPGGGQGAGFRLAVADGGEDHQIGVVEGGAKGVGQTVAQLAPLVDGAGQFRGAVAAKAAGKGKVPEQGRQALGVLPHLRVDLGIAALQVHRRQHPGGAVAGAGHKDGVEVVLCYHPVGVDVHERQPGARPPVPQQALHDVFWLKWLPKQWVVPQVDRPRRQVVAGALVTVDGVQLAPVERFYVHGSFLCETAVSTNSRTWRAISNSSLARITSTATVLSPAWIGLISPLASRLRSGSIRTPRWASPAQARARTSGAFSPTPAVKARASIPPRAAL